MESIKSWDNLIPMVVQIGHYKPALQALRDTPKESNSYTL